MLCVNLHFTEGKKALQAVDLSIVNCYLPRPEVMVIITIITNIIIITSVQ